MIADRARARRPESAQCLTIATVCQLPLLHHIPLVGEQIRTGGGRDRVKVWQ